MLAPLSLVFYQSFLTGPFFQPTAQLSLDAYSFVFGDPDFWSAFGTTLLLASRHDDDRGAARRRASPS